MDSRDTLLRRIDGLTRRARGFLLWERFAPVLALGAAALLIFLIGSFAGLWERIGDPWRLLALIAALALIGRSLWKARAVDVPDVNAARRRVEADSALEHRPFDTVRDALAKTPNSDASLWDKHTQIAANAAASAGPARLRPVLAARDKYYLRYALPAALGLSLMLGAGDSLERLRAALTPGWLSAVSASDAKYEAWIDPPDYTGRPPVYFKNKSRIDAPAGSELVARVSGIKDAPRLYINEGGKGRRVAVTRLGPKSFEARTILNDNAKARWRIGAQPQEWRIDVQQDEAPTVEFVDDPKASKRDKLEFKYDLIDDFGAVSLSLEMTLIDEGEAAAGEAETFAVPMPGQSVRKAEDVLATLDLTKHRWAGRRVSGRLVALDFKDQRGESEAVTFIVPDRIFISPLAKAVIENRNLLLAAEAQPYGPAPQPDEYSRRDLIDPLTNAPITLIQDAPDARLSRAPAAVQRSALLLDAITDAPVNGFRDPVVFMGLKNVQARLRDARAMDDLSDAPEDLWLIAMRAEFGPLGNAKEAMIAAEAALRDGIARRARQREVDTLFQRYNEAVDRYMEFLMESATVSEAEGGGGGGGGRNTDEIQALLDAIEEANRMGDTEGARRALAQLAELLENMRIELTKGGGGGEGESIDSDGLSEEVKEALEDIADALGEQRELQDQTEQAERQQEQGQQQDGQQQGEQQGGQSQGGQSQGGQSQGGQSGAQQQAENGESGPDAGEGDAPSADQLAQNQAALQGALDALEESLRDAGTDMSATPQGNSGGQDNPNGNTGGGGDDPDAPPGSGGGGESDPNAPPGSGGGGDEADPDGDSLLAQIDENGDGGISAEEALDAARRAMQQSADSLSAEDFAAAQEAQDLAIEALRAAAAGLIAQSSLGQEGEDGEQAGGQAGQGRGNDPFGREADGDGNATGLGATVPEKSDRQRARELIEELRRRAAEQNRSQEELDYLDRLLERF